MELDSLKYIWHSLAEPAVREPDRKWDKEADRKSAWRTLLQKKSKGLVARMRRNLFGELILVIVTYVPAILFYWIDFNGRLAAIAWSMLGVMLIFGGYFYRKNRLLCEMQCVECEVRSNLGRQLRSLKKYIRFYLVAGTLLIPVMAILSYGIIRLELPSAGPVFYNGPGAPQWWERPGIWLLLLAPLTIGIYYVNVWYVNKLYGRHIKKLQELLQEMEGE